VGYRIRTIRAQVVINFAKSIPRTDRDRKELLRTLLEEVILNLKRAEGHAHMTLRWRGGAFTTLDVPVPKFKPNGAPTRIQSRCCAVWLLFIPTKLLPEFQSSGAKDGHGRALHRQSGRQLAPIPRDPATPPDGELVTIRKTAQILGMNTSSIHRWLADGFIAGEQVRQARRGRSASPRNCARASCRRAAPEYVPMIEATAKLGVSRQTVFQRVKLGELEAVLVRKAGVKA
jgi:predicted DNA-binding transcriptional regulator AlpA